MTVEPFKTAHYAEIAPRNPAEIDGLAAGQWERMLAQYESNPSWTMRDDAGRVVFFGGVLVMWPGVGEAWSVMSDLVERYPLAVVREVRRRLAEAIAEKGLRRVQVIISDDNPRALKMMRLAGFEVEGILRQYSPDGRDCFILGRLE